MSKYLLPLAGLLLVAQSLKADDAEDRAVTAVQNLGGEVQRNDKAPAQPVEAVFLAWRNHVADADLKDLAAFKGLRILVLVPH